MFLAYKNDSFEVFFKFCKRMLNEYEVYISYFHPFGCQCFILNTKDNLGKFDSKCDNGALLRCSKTSKAYRVYKSRTLVEEEAIHVRFKDTTPDI